jgi:anti-sigma B factor antagonist
MPTTQLEIAHQTLLIFDEEKEKVEEAIAALEQGGVKVVIANPFSYQGFAFLSLVRQRFKDVFILALWPKKEPLYPKDLLEPLDFPTLLQAPYTLEEVERKIERFMKRDEKEELREGLNLLQKPFLFSPHVQADLSSLSRKGELSLFFFHESGQLIDLFLLSIEETAPQPLLALALGKEEILNPLIERSEEVSYSHATGWVAPKSPPNSLKTKSLRLTHERVYIFDKQGKNEIILTTPHGGKVSVTFSIDRHFVEKPQELVLMPDESQEPILHRFIEDLTSKVPGDRELLRTALHIASQEIFTNCLSHGGLDIGRDKIIFRGKLQKEGVLLECLDQGKPFDPTSVPFPDFSGDKGRGFGLYFIKEVVDAFSYLPKKDGGWNIFKIEKKYFWREEEEKMSIHHESHPEYLLVTLKMEYLDTRLAPKLREELKPLIEAESSKTVIVDLGAVHFIDSSGFGALITLLKECKRLGKRLVLVALTHHAESSFKMLNLDKLFEIFPSLEAATATASTKKS